MSHVLVHCACPDEATAEHIATALVEERLAACVNRVPGITSIYRWQGKICRDAEQLLLIKTTRERFETVRARILALHPYELPEVMAVDIAAGHLPYLDWIGASTRDA